VQALRALAAMSVAFSHTAANGLQLVPSASGLAWLYHDANPWNGGVDVFFVISGFVITLSSQSLFGRNGATWTFLGRRLARIVPLYWAMTTLFLLTMVLLPSTIQSSKGQTGSLLYILASYLFIPAARPDGVVAPILQLGWSLNFEMFFYLVFAPFLRFTKTTATISVAVLLAGFVLLGQTGILPGTILNYWAEPIILEFCAGMFLALLPGRVTLSTGVRVALTIAAVAWFAACPPWSRDFSRGIPAVALVIAAVTGPQEGALPKLEAWLVRLGDASYALYLVHPFAMRVGAVIWTHLRAHLGHPGLIWVYVVLCLIAAQVAALWLHRAFERPVTSQVRQWLVPAPA
jgi:peptidoglycan/LPS O-acetylase OafA/YrhL